MPEEPEVETQELQETLDELHEERREREESEKRNAWTRYIALSTAFLAVFAAIGAMLSGAAVNEAMMSQIQASDKWNEYQADSLKAHTYTIAANALLDAGAQPPAAKEAADPPAEPPSGERQASKKGKKEAGGEKPAGKKKASLKSMSTSGRAAFYRDQIDKEYSKMAELQEGAKKLKEESEERMNHHHRFALSVAFIQVAIALSAISALTRMKLLWGVSMLVGAAGIVCFGLGF